MKLSIYTCVKNGLYYDYHLIQMLSHHLPLADEIVVNEGFSTDRTYQEIKNLDEKIKVFRCEWDESDPITFFEKIKETARKKCSGDWCISLDCDEFIPEWQFDAVREYLLKTDKDILSMQYINFYGSYKTYVADPSKLNWMERKYAIHRNLQEIEVWGDGSNVRFREKKMPERFGSTHFIVHHFGFVRDPARLREKWRKQSRTYRTKPKYICLQIPSWVYRLFPHSWNDPDILPHLGIYNGPCIKPVMENPGEFVRDKFRILKILAKKNDKTLKIDE